MRQTYGSTWSWPTKGPSATSRLGPGSPPARVHWVPSSSWHQSPSTTGHRVTTPVGWPGSSARSSPHAKASPRRRPLATPAACRRNRTSAVRKDIGHGDDTGHEPGDDWAAAMAMTAAVKDELSRLVVTKPCDRKAEMASLLRFAGGLHLVGGRIVVE